MAFYFEKPAGFGFKAGQFLEKESPNSKLIATRTGMEKSSRPWQGETGYINKEMLAKFIGDLTAPIYYVAGPPAMVTGMRKMLQEVGVNNKNIRAEAFAGYR